MSFLDRLHKRRKKLADVLSDEEYKGIRQIVEDLYPDQAHFIYELLQNAEDKGATELNFNLKDDGLTFEHNGRSFNEKDVERITNIGERTKEEQEDKIGLFGIGFKAVFAYTETPYIWSPTYSFKITELVLPSEIPPNQELRQKTRFEFPFNNPKKFRETAYEEVAAGLRELAETTLLFLRNIESIGWELGDSISGEVLRIQHSEHHVEVLKQIGNKETFSSHFFRFSTPLEIDGRPIQSVSVAYPLEFLPNVSKFDPRNALSKQLKIVPANPGRVAIFFPAEKEISGLRFHLHAPFVPELSRASIKETPANDPLFNQIAKLVASSLYEIKNLGLLTGEFLAVLPNPQDALSKKYAPIRQAVIKAMNNEPLTPTYSKSHAPAQHLLQAKASLKELLSEEDLQFLIKYENEPPKWAISASQRNSNQDRFLAGLEIKPWDVDQFIELLSEKTSEKKHSWEGGPDQDFMQWLSAKPSEWHQQMYSTLYKELSENENFYQLEAAQIIRLSTGTYSTGSKCFFPADGIDHDEVLPRVNRQVYESGKRRGQQDDARKFLEKIGVREVGEVEAVEGILKTRYTLDAKVSDKKTYLKDLRRFIRLVEQDTTKAELFASYYIFESDNKKPSTPSMIFLDSPFSQTGLSAYYDALGEETAPRALSPKYKDYGIELTKLVKFAIAVGVNDKLSISETNCRDNPERDYLYNVPGERYTSPKNQDYVVKGLDKLLKSPSIELSRLVWRTMCDLDEKCLKATFRKNWSSGERNADSQLVHLLKVAAWVPQKDGSFVRPCDASRDRLPKGFLFDEGQAWLDGVNFGTTAQELKESVAEKDKHLKALGISNPKTIDIAMELDRDPELLSQVSELINAKKKKTVFPKSPVMNPERRKERIAEQLKDSPKKKYEPRTRSVRITEATEYTRVWLKEQYTNDKAQMVCQICKKEMPFKKRDGEYYFEAVEALSNDHFTKEHEAQFLALCPLCAARYKEFVKQDEDAMESFKNALLNSDKPELSLQLGNLSTSVQFVESHWHDIRTILQNTGKHS